MDAGCHFAGTLEMGTLIIEEKMRFEDFQDPTLFDSAEKENLVREDSPALEGFYYPLMGRSVARGYDRRANEGAARHRLGSLMLL